MLNQPLIPRTVALHHMINLYINGKSNKIEPPSVNGMLVITLYFAK